MTTEELIEAAKELVELDRRKTLNFDSGADFYNHCSVTSAKNAKALIVAVEALKNIESRRGFGTSWDIAGESLTKIQKIAEE